MPATFSTRMHDHSRSDAIMVQTFGRDAADVWRLLNLLNLYRLLIAGLFVAMPWLDAEQRIFANGAPGLFGVVSLAYLLFGVASLLATRGRWPAFKVQAHIQVFADILAITLIMHASGGVGSGLGMLLLIAIAGGSILMPGRTATLFAATATLAILAEQLYAQLTFGPSMPNYTQAGLLGATFFTTAALTHALARRIRDSETLAAQRGVDLADMQQLTEYIIQRMQTGVVVIDAEENVRLINESARHLLGAPGAQGPGRLDRISPELASQLHTWLHQPDAESHTFRPAITSATVLPRFARMGAAPSSGTLIFLEDTAALAQQAQQMKLASLGRLTASIAHEIRNPLGAISHAGQLLAESPALDKHDARLTQIIADQSQRVNAIIENVLQLSRRDRSRPQDFALEPWLKRFAEEFSRSENIAMASLSVGVTPADLQVRIDPSQLHQIVRNLCENALRHNPRTMPAIALRGGVTRESGVPFLDVIDNGPGIAAGVAEQIFEPFFTTSPNGIGLGLYISRELCECNQARLNYRAQPDGGCFRITFADPRRRQVA